MDMKYATYFLAIARYKSLSKAADYLFVSQSTLSQFLAREEQELGVRLVMRNRNELSLTYEGQLYEETCRNMVSLQESLYKKLAEAAGSKTGHISIGITPQWGGEMFAEIFPTFKQKYPNYLVNLLEDTTKPLLEQVTRGTLDIAILAAAESAPITLPNVSMCREELILAVPVSVGEQTRETGTVRALTGAEQNQAAGRAKAFLPSADIASFRSENFIISCSGTAIRDITNGIFEQKKITPRVICEINNHSSSLKMVASGLGITIIPASYICDNPNILFFSIGKGVYWNICTVAKRNFHPSEPDNYLMDLVRGYFLRE